MADRSPARILAPLALIAAFIGVVLVIALSAGSDSSAPVKTSRPAATTQSKPARAKPRVYVVKSGDSLTAIAEKTGVSVDVIEQLNSDVDPQALRVGERLKLRQ